MVDRWVTVQVWGRPPVCRFTESLTPWLCWRRNAGPEARPTGRPEVCPTQLHGPYAQVLLIEEARPAVDYPGAKLAAYRTSLWLSDHRRLIDWQGADLLDCAKRPDNLDPLDFRGCPQAECYRQFRLR